MWLVGTYYSKTKNTEKLKPKNIPLRELSENASQTPRVSKRSSSQTVGNWKDYVIINLAANIGAISGRRRKLSSPTKEGSS